MKKLLKNYVNTFSGLSKEVWWFALITLVNRLGTMVIPFLSLYLTKGLNFELSDVGWIMSCFGIGSVIGSWLGGKLTDLIGSYRVMLISLISVGILFILLQFVNTFIGFCIAITVLMIVSDTFRPAMYVALGMYSKPENRTRSISLMRLAINLGFSLGPVVGGLIITTLSYKGLFWVDGITCISAGMLLLYVLHPKKVKVSSRKTEVANPISPYSDKPYWVFLLAIVLFGIAFLQYFSTIPVFYKEVHNLTEFEIGMLMGANGAIIFLIEMPIVKWLETKKQKKILFMIFGGLILSFSIVLLNFSTWSGILILGVLLMTLGQMIAFPLSNAFAMERAQRGKQGDYLALYSMSFPIAHIFSHNSGMRMIDKLGFSKTWYIIFGIALLSALLMVVLGFMTKGEK